MPLLVLSTDDGLKPHTDKRIALVRARHLLQRVGLTS